MVVELQNPLHYAITDLRSTCAGADERRVRLHEQVRDWARRGVHFVQLREKDLDAGEQFRLAMAALPASEDRQRPLLLVNGRADVAAAAAADGVHLTAHPEELRPAQVRSLFRAAGRDGCVVSVSCHGLDEVARACDGGADLILFGPIFEKRVAGEVVHEGVGLDTLRQAALLAGAVPVLALGGITRENAPACLDVGALGFAGIRLFRE